jgi:hypothetical protein
VQKLEVTGYLSLIPNVGTFIIRKNIGYLYLTVPVCDHTVAVNVTAGMDIPTDSGEYLSSSWLECDCRVEWSLGWYVIH